jgi:tRNA nucleotidyltransferase (CCA-adding enzyme)
MRRLAELPAAQPLLRTLADDSHVYVVGGAVRDLLLGGSPVDLDLVTEDDPAELVAALGGALRTYDRFGTATVTVAGHAYDVARARRERYAAPGLLPEVEPAPLDEDLQRRDFTVNAAAIGLTDRELHVLPATLADLDARVLRVLHDRSFIDDPTRLFRLARYAARLGFEIDPHTRALADAAIAGGALTTVSGPRIGAELLLLAGEADPVAAFAALAELGVDVGFGPIDPRLAAAAFELLPPDGDPAAVALSLAASRTQELRGLLDRFGFEARARDTIVAAALHAEPLASALGAATRPSEIAAAAVGAQPELVAVAGAFGPAEKARDWLRALRHVKLEIGGADLLAAGVPEGPAVGRGLAAALAAKLDGRTSGRDAELAEALSAAR